MATIDGSLTTMPLPARVDAGVGRAEVDGQVAGEQREKRTQAQRTLTPCGAGGGRASASAISILAAVLDAVHRRVGRGAAAPRACRAAAGSVAAPTDAVRRIVDARRPPGTACAATRSRTRRATSIAPSRPVSGRTTRELVAAEPRHDVGLARADADDARRPRPAPGCRTDARSVSLIPLNPSRSTNSSDSGRPVRTARFASRRSASLQEPRVVQPRQVVGRPTARWPAAAASRCRAPRRCRRSGPASGASAASSGSRSASPARGADSRPTSAATGRPWLLHRDRDQARRRRPPAAAAPATSIDQATVPRCTTRSAAAAIAGRRARGTPRSASHCRPRLSWTDRTAQASPPNQSTTRSSRCPAIRSGTRVGAGGAHQRWPARRRDAPGRASPRTNSRSRGRAARVPVGRGGASPGGPAARSRSAGRDRVFERRVAVVIAQASSGTTLSPSLPRKYTTRRAAGRRPVRRIFAICRPPGIIRGSAAAAQLAATAGSGSRLQASSLRRP